MCQLNIVVEGRALDDDGAVMFKTASGATGVLMATQVAAGEEKPESAFSENKAACAGSRRQQYIDNDAAGCTGSSVALGAGLRNLAWPTTAFHGSSGGLFEAFANLYKNFAAHVKAQAAGKNEIEL